MGWSSAANLKEEIIAQALVDRLGLERAKEIFPVNVNPDEETMPAQTPKKRKVGRPGDMPLQITGDRAVMSLAALQDPSLHMGSNNWVTGAERSARGKPIVANDPHLDARILPGPWYTCGLILPSLRAVGVSIPGIPGIVIGRNDRVAFGVTNSYGDAQDLYIETLDPSRPDHYLEGKTSLPFTTLAETFRIRDKKAPGGYRNQTQQIRLTRRGPVVSGIFPGLKGGRVMTLRWSPFESMGSVLGFETLWKARSAADVRTALGGITTIMLNFVFADVDGHFGWQTTGRLPVRSQGESLLPHVVVDDRDNWRGWIPYASMPQSFDPPKGWVGTCNHYTVGNDYPYYYSAYASASYRYRRLKEWMAGPEKRTAEAHWGMQRDVQNLLAREMAPIFARILQSSRETETLGGMLGRWNHEDALDQAAPALFQVLYRQLALEVFQDELGEEATQLLIDTPYFWQERLGKMIREGQSPWFDDATTPNVKEGLAELVRRSALKAQGELTNRLGSDPSRWQWGEIHRISFVSPLRREGFGRDWVGGGTHPMAGSQETLYRASYDYNRPFAVVMSASLRMVADLGDPDKVLAVLPGGVSARHLVRHQKDQVGPFMTGEPRYWWFSDAMIAAHAKTTLQLQP